MRATLLKVICGFSVILWIFLEPPYKVISGVSYLEGSVRLFIL